MNYTLSVGRNWLPVVRAGWQPEWLRGIETIRVPEFAGYPTVFGWNATTMRAVGTLAILRPQKELYRCWRRRRLSYPLSACWCTHFQCPPTYVKERKSHVVTKGYKVLVTINLCVDSMARWLKLIIRMATVRFKGANKWRLMGGI